MRDETESPQRRSERKKVEMAVTLMIEGDEAELFADTVDVSCHGLRAQTDASLAPGQPVGLMFPSIPNCYIKARIVWVGKAETGQSGQAGFEFLNPLTVPMC